jgi:hypothetical protein
MKWARNFLWPQKSLSNIISKFSNEGNKGHIFASHQN